MTKQPFWAVMTRDLHWRGNVNLYYYGGEEEEDRIPIMPSNYGNNGMMKAAASVQGPFLTFVTNLRRENTVSMSDPTVVERKINIQLYSFAEPKAVPMQIQYEPTVDEAADENGNSMMPDREDNPRNMQSSRARRMVRLHVAGLPEGESGQADRQAQGAHGGGRSSWAASRGRWPIR